MKSPLDGRSSLQSLGHVECRSENCFDGADLQYDLLHMFHEQKEILCAEIIINIMTDYMGLHLSIFKLDSACQIGNVEPAKSSAEWSL